VRVEAEVEVVFVDAGNGVVEEVVGGFVFAVADGDSGGGKSGLDRGGSSLDRWKSNSALD
jgi:hypothetical protein